MQLLISISWDTTAEASSTASKALAVLGFCRLHWGADNNIGSLWHVMLSCLYLLTGISQEGIISDRESNAKAPEGRPQCLTIFCLAVQSERWRCHPQLLGQLGSEALVGVPALKGLHESCI